MFMTKEIKKERFNYFKLLLHLHGTHSYRAK